MKEILIKRCEINGTNDYYFQGISSIYNFEHRISNNTVYVFKKGVQIKEIKSEKELIDFLNNLTSYSNIEKNKNDDAPDATAGLCMMLRKYYYYDKVWNK